MTLVLSAQNRFRVAAELDAAKVAAQAAALVGNGKDLVSAQSRLDRAARAVTAVAGDDSTELAAGQPILWVNTFGAAVEDGPIGILTGRIVGEAAPVDLVTGDIPRRYVALVESRWGGYVERVVHADDVIATQDHASGVGNRPAHGHHPALVDLVAAAFGDVDESPALSERTAGDGTSPSAAEPTAASDPGLPDVALPPASPPDTGTDL